MPGSSVTKRRARMIAVLAVAFFALSSPASADSPSADGSPEQSPGAIAGRVTAAATAAGLANVTVRIHNSSGALVLSATTNASGNYTTSTPLATGTYFARTTNSLGYIDELYNNIPCASFCTVTSGTPISVTSGATTTNINFALDAGGWIAGAVTNAATGAPLANAGVNLYNAAGTFVLSSATDASGTYTTAAVAGGTYFARTSNASGYIDELYDNIPCAPSCTVTTGTPISVTAGAPTSNINFALSPGGWVAGTVTNAATGAALANVSVSIYASNGSLVSSHTTNASGGYTTTPLPAGTYYARTANAQSFINELYNNIRCEPTCTATTGTPITVTAGVTTSNIDFALSAGGRVAGTVTNAATGAPLASVTVSIYNSAGTFVVSGATNASGTYTTPLVPSGTYFARTSSASEYIDELYDNIPCEPTCTATTGTPISVTAGAGSNATTGNINFALAAGGRVAGTVTNAATGAPLANVLVTISDSTGTAVDNQSTDAAGNYTMTTPLSPGTYFARTSNSLGFINELYDDIRCDPVCTVTTGTPISVTAGATTGSISFALAAGGRVAGSVTNAATGAPLANVVVSLYNAAGTFVLSSATSASGSYTTPLLPTGTYFARTANSFGYFDELYDNISCASSCTVTTGTPISVTAGATTGNITFALSEGGRIAGTVTNAATGAALANVTVGIFDGAGTSVKSAITNASGSYAATLLPTGTYFARTLNAPAQGFVNELYADIACVLCDETTGTPIAVTAGAGPSATTSNINFTLAVGGSVTGTVTNAVTGATLAGVTVRVYNASGSVVTAVATDAYGNYATAAMLPAGTYFARSFASTVGVVNELYDNIQCGPATCPIDETAGTPITVSAGATTSNITFALAVGGSVAGTVTSAATGAPLESVIVEIYNSAGMRFTNGFTDFYGNYTIGGLATGTYYARTLNSLGFIDELYNGTPCLSCNVANGTPISVTSDPSATTNNIDFTLDPGGRIAGSVTSAATGVGLAGVTVQIHDSSGLLITSALTNSSGAYTTGTGLPSGNYFARTVNAAGFLDEVYNDVVCLLCNVTKGAPIAVTASATTGNIDFALAAGGRISGVVIRAANSSPLENVTVQIHNAAGSLVTSATTNTSGSYVTGSGLPTGTYFARTSNTQGFIDELYNDIACLACTVTSGTPISVTAGASANATTSGIDFALAKGGRLSGTVTSAATSLGLPGVEIFVYNSAGTLVVATATTNAVGGYTTGTGLPGATYFVRTSNALGFIDKLYNNIICTGCDVTTGTPVSIAAAATTSGVNFALTAGGRVSGRVIDRVRDVGLGGVGVQIYSSTGSFVASFTSDASGAYTIGTGLPSGTYFARTVNDRGFIDELYNDRPCAGCNVTTGTPIAVTAGGAGATTSGIDFALDIGGRIAGTVTYAPTGAPLSNVRVEIYNASGSIVASRLTDGSGTWATLTGLPAGNYFARTFNPLGYQDLLYNNIPCNTCTVTTGTPIAVTVPHTTVNVNFPLSPPGTAAPFIIAGLTAMSSDGGWVAIRRDLPNGLAHETWRRVPWPAYNAAGGGERVAAGDVDGDGLDEIVIGLNAGGQGWIVVLDDGQHGYALLGWTQVPWTSYNATNGEVFPAAGDVDGDGIAEIIAGLGPGGAGWFAIFEGADQSFAFASWRRVNWPAYNAGSDGATHPAVADVDSDGYQDIVLGLAAGSAGWLEIKNGGFGGFTTKQWIQVSWPAYNSQNGTTYPAASGELIAIGLGQGGAGWLETRGGGSTNYTHARWVHVSWPAYNNANGETHPALGNLNAVAGPELVVGFAPFDSAGGWFDVIDPVSGASLGWRNVDWGAFTSAGGGLWPAVGRIK